MSEAKWLACIDHPKLMLDLLKEKAKDRKLRLFSCACCRRIWHLMTDERSRIAVEVAEQFADGQTSEEERKRVQGIAAELRSLTSIAAKWASAASARTGAVAVVDPAGQAAACPGDQEYDPSKWEAEWKEQCRLLRDIFGNPFRSIAINSAWLTSKVTALAQTIYTGRAFDKMPELADALQEAGCTNEAILGHCRGPGPHVRGCWVVDLVLGKE